MNKLLRVLAAAALCFAAAAPVSGDYLVHYTGGDGILVQTPNETLFRSFEREAVERCTPVQPVAEIPNENKSVIPANSIYIGNALLLNFQRTFPGSYVVHSCEPGKLKEGVPCKFLTKGNSSAFISNDFTDAVYVEPRSLLQFDRESGNFLVTGPDTSACLGHRCRFNSVELAKGSFDTFCPKLEKTLQSSSNHYSAAAVSADRFMIACGGSDDFALVQISTLGSSNSRGVSVVQTGKGLFPVSEDVSASSLSLVRLDKSLVMAYQRGNGAYKLYRCLHECTEVWEGNVGAAPICSHNTNKDTCIADGRCGWCYTEGKCLEAFEGKQCYGTCDTFVTASGEVPSGRSEVVRADDQFIYIDEDVVMNYSPTKGTYKMYETVTNPTMHKGQCPTFSTSPVYEGKLPFKGYTASAFGNRTVLYVNNDKGNYYLWRCDDFTFEQHIGLLAPCSIVGMGDWKASIGAGDVFSINNSTFIYDEKSSTVAVYEHLQNDGLEDSFYHGVFNETADANITLPKVKERSLLFIGSHYVLDHNRKSNEYRVYAYDKVSKEFFGPGASGHFPLSSKLSPVWIGNDRLLFIYDADSKGYAAMRFDPSALGTPGNLPLTTIGTGHVTRGHCSEATSCKECAGNLHCGWCAETQSCQAGTEAANCLDFAHDPCSEYAGTIEKCSAIEEDKISVEENVETTMLEFDLITAGQR